MPVPNSRALVKVPKSSTQQIGEKLLDMIKSQAMLNYLASTGGVASGVTLADILSHFLAKQAYDAKLPVQEKAAVFSGIRNFFQNMQMLNRISAALRRAFEELKKTKGRAALDKTKDVVTDENFLLGAGGGLTGSLFYDALSKLSAHQKKAADAAPLALPPAQSPGFFARNKGPLHVAGGALGGVALYQLLKRLFGRENTPEPLPIMPVPVPVMAPASESRTSDLLLKGLSTLLGGTAGGGLGYLAGNVTGLDPRLTAAIGALPGAFGGYKLSDLLSGSK